MKERTMLAIDLGASSGRGVLGHYDSDRKLLTMEEIHRFPNQPVRIMDTLYWDYAAIYQGILDCLRVCKRQGVILDSLAIDAWGQDYAFIGSEGSVLGLPHSYRDPERMAHSGELNADLDMEPWDVYLQSGRPAASISTLRQLHYDRKYHSHMFNEAKCFLHMPYLFAYLLSGAKGYDLTYPTLCEYGDAATLDVSKAMAERGGFLDKLPDRFEVSTIIGRTNQTVLKETGYDSVPVVCVHGHDTASAVSAVPDEGEFLWISSGSSSMLGAVTWEPKVNETLFRCGAATTPLGDGRICTMTGAGGMYYIQQCMSLWDRQGISVSYDELASYALDNPSESWFDFSDIPAGATQMPEAICEAVAKQGFSKPKNPGEIYAAFVNAQARAVAAVLEQIEEGVGKRFDRIYVFSGGSKAAVLNARLAEFTGKTVLTGLVEASVAGNLLSQLPAIGAAATDEILQISKNSFEIQKFTRRRSYEF